MKTSSDVQDLDYSFPEQEDIEGDAITMTMEDLDSKFMSFDADTKLLKLKAVTFERKGVYTPTVTLTDSKGGSTSYTLSITIEYEALEAQVEEQELQTEEEP